MPARTETPPADPDDLLTAADGEAETGIPARTLRGAAKRGAIASRRVGTTHLLDRKSLAVYARTHKSRGRNARKPEPAAS